MDKDQYTARISREEMLIEIAHIAARRGTCDRLHVGAIIARESRPISLGYAGVPSGEPHCNPSICDTSKPCTRTTHAEHNALLFATTHGIDIRGADMFITDSPCLSCAGKIQVHGIQRVFYDRPYRITSGIEFLQSKGIEVVRVFRPIDE